jgi:phosphopantetheinyl transferase (holo-ACP synthase)
MYAYLGGTAAEAAQDELTAGLQPGFHGRGDDVAFASGGATYAAGTSQRLRGRLLGEPAPGTSDVTLVSRRIVDRAKDRYLDDHTLGHTLAGSRRSALAVMPLTMSLEILAEAAVALIPGKTVIGMRHVVAHRWLAFDERPQTIEVTATKIGNEQGIDLVSVYLSSLDDPHREASTSPAVEAVVELSETYRVAPQPLPPTEGAAPLLGSDELYRSVMFHGPLWQGVASVDVIGPKGAAATLQVLPVREYFDDVIEPVFEIDPVTSDAAGQVIGFWTSEVLDSGRIVFPFLIDRLDVYGPPAEAGTVVACRTAIELVGANLTSSTIDVLYPDGQLWMRLSGWQDKRFDLPRQFEPLLLPGGAGEISDRWTAPIAVFGNEGAIECRIVSAAIDADRPFWSRVWSEAVLDPEERALFSGLRSPEPRRLEWLAARTAAKEAVRSLIRANFGLELSLTDVLILSDEQGAPRVECDALGDSAYVPVVSMTHSAGVAAAVAGLVEQVDGSVGARLGLDIERQKQLPDGFVETAFDDSERLVLQLAGVGSSNEWSLRAWCAKEAIAKAIGSGLIEGPRSLQILQVDVTTGTVVARAVGLLAAAAPIECNTYVAHTGTDELLVFATSVCDLTTAGS